MLRSDHLLWSIFSCSDWVLRETVWFIHHIWEARLHGSAYETWTHCWFYVTPVPLYQLGFSKNLVLNFMLRWHAVFCTFLDRKFIPLPLVAGVSKRVKLVMEVTKPLVLCSATRTSQITMRSMEVLMPSRMLCFCMDIYISDASIQLRVSSVSARWWWGLNLWPSDK